VNDVCSSFEKSKDFAKLLEKVEKTFYNGRTKVDNIGAKINLHRNESGRPIMNCK